MMAKLVLIVGLIVLATLTYSFENQKTKEQEILEGSPGVLIPHPTTVVAAMRGKRVAFVGESTSRQAHGCIVQWAKDRPCLIPSLFDDQMALSLRGSDQTIEIQNQLHEGLVKTSIGTGQLSFFARPFFKNVSDWFSSPTVRETLFHGRNHVDLVVIALGLHDLLYSSSLSRLNQPLDELLAILAHLENPLAIPIVIVSLPPIDESALNPFRFNVSHFRSEHALQISRRLEKLTINHPNHLSFLNLSLFMPVHSHLISADGIHSSHVANQIAQAILDRLYQSQSTALEKFSKTGIALLITLFILIISFGILVSQEELPHHSDPENPSVLTSTPPEEVPSVLLFGHVINTPPRVVLLNILMPIGAILLLLCMMDGPLRISLSNLKLESLDVLVTISLIFFLGSLFLGRRDLGEEKHVGQHVMNRHQTEEWKGLMMLCFLLYHLFHVEEVYNLIRVMVGAFVFLTGFGNASFFLNNKDFSVQRVIRVFLRINFIVFLVCAILDIPFIFYYVCALHSWSFLIVYFTFLPSLLLSRPASTLFVLVSILLSCFFAVFLFDTEIGHWIFHQVLFKPFHSILSSSEDVTPLREWYFRSRLDYLAVYAGMITAVALPYFNHGLQILDALPSRMMRWILRLSIVVSCLFFFICWWTSWGSIPDKFEYNRYHPYWEFIPMMCYLVLRNLFSNVRRFVLVPFQKIGTITLELYVMQCHLWMSDAAKTQLVILPRYPFLNFAITSFVMATVAQYAFDSTTEAIALFAPAKAPLTLILKRILGVMLLFTIFYMLQI